MITIRTPSQTLLAEADILSELAAAAVTQELHEHAAELASASNAHRAAAESLKVRTDETDSDGWIPWSGGKCPIPWAKAGEYGIRFSDGYEASNCKIDASDWDWGDDGVPNDIIAYRILTK